VTKEESFTTLAPGIRNVFVDVKLGDAGKKFQASAERCKQVRLKLSIFANDLWPVLLTHYDSKLRL